MPASYFEPVGQEEDAFDAIERLRAQRASYAASATPEMAHVAGQLGFYYPWMPAGATLSLAKADVKPESPVARTAAKAAAKKKRKSGLGWHSIGDVVKGAVRGVTTVASAPLEEAQGQFRDVVKATREHGVLGGAVNAATHSVANVMGVGERWDRDNPQSNLGVAFKQFRDEGRVDLGQGYFPGGTAAKQQAANARALASIDGHAVTPGRWLANLVVEPGTKPYSVMSGLADMAVAIADPSSKAMGGTGKARQATKLFMNDAGLVNAARKTVLPEVADAWLSTKKGRGVVDRLAGMDSVDDIWKASNKKIPVGVAVELADAKTPDAVADVIRTHAGIALREKPELGGVGVTVRRHLEGVRLAQAMPGRHLSLDDMDDAVEQLDRFQKNARLPLDVIKANNEALARATSRAEQYQVVVNATSGAVREAIENSGGAGREVARELVRHWNDTDAEYAKYFVNEVGENIPVFGAVLSGNGVPLPTPHLWNEYVNRAIPLPDARDIRRATSRASKWIGQKAEDAPLPWRVTSEGWKAGNALLDFTMNDLWKPAQLLRGAWTVRVVGEEQIRMAMSGLDSVFSHPLSAIARVVASDTPYREGRLLGRATPANLAVAAGRGTARTLEAAGRALERVGVEDAFGAARGRAGLLGDELANTEEAQQALIRGAAGFMDRGELKLRDRVLVRKGNRRYAEALADELGKMSADPVTREVLSRTPDEAKEWFWSGAGQKFRRDIAAQHDELEHRVRVGGSYADDRTVKSADDYIDSIYDRVKVKTGGRADLIDAITSGYLGPNPIRNTIGDTSYARREIARLVRDEGAGPDVVVGERAVKIAGRGQTALSYYDYAVDAAMNSLMSRPSNFLSRSRAFEQFYWQRAEELLPFMSSGARTEALDAARNANLGRSAMKRLETAAQRGSGDLSLEDADVLAKAFGIDSTKKLLYDLADRSQWTDVMRHIAPFGEAWKEILTSWARIGVETHGKPIRRAQQVIQGARGAGFFHTDEATGEEVFSYPGSQFVTGAVTGVPTPFTGNVASLNLFSNNPLLPGAGPLVQVSVGKLIPEKPSYDWLRDLITPYGEADTGGGFVESFLPAWFQKVRKAMADPESDRLFANTVFDMARYLKSTGKYGDDPDAMEQLQEDSVKAAKRLYIVRAITQFGAPAAPTPQMMARDADGNLTTAFTLTEAFRKLQDADYTTAVETFLDTFGEDALLYMQPKSQGGVTPTDTLHDWVRDNGDVVKRYNKVYGFFAPEGGDFSLTEMERQIATGERKAIKPDEAVRLANHRVASMVYRAAREKVGETMNTENRQWLGQVREALVEQYPGYEPERYDATKVPDMVRQFTEAAADPRLADTDAGQGLNLYLMARERAMTEAQARGFSTFGRAKGARDLREWLRAVAAAVGEEHPAFSRMFEEGLSREMADDAEEQEQVA